MEENRVINVLYSLTLTKNRDDIGILMITKMNCLAYFLILFVEIYSNSDGHARILLTKFVTSGSKVITSILPKDYS